MDYSFLRYEFKRIPILLIALLLALSLVFNLNGDYWSSVINPCYYLLFTIIVIAGFCLINREGMRINFLDLLVCLIFIDSWITRSIRLGNIQYDSDDLVTLVLLIYYLSLKKIDWDKRLLDYYNLLLLISLGLCAYALCELYEVIETENSIWPVTGNFSNPGPFGGFLAVLFSIGVQLAIQELNIRNRYFIFYVCSIGLVISIIVLTGSRAAMLSAMLVIVFFIMNRFPGKLIWKILLVLAICVLLVAVFMNKGGDSIAGRILIWRISLNAMTEHPFIGIGYNFFRADYLNFQAEYFRQGMFTRTEMLLAGDTQFAFNELIKFALESGLLGVFLLIACLTVSIKMIFKNKNVLASSSIAMIISFSIFALFSYPLTFFCFKLLILNQVAIISGTDKRSIAKINPSVSAGLFGILSGVILVLGLKLVIAIEDWRDAFVIQYKDEKRARELFLESSKSLSGNDKFLFMYGDFLQDKFSSKSSTLLESSLELVSNPKVYTKLGDNYEHRGLTKRAEKMFLTVHYMIPILLKPQEKLMDFYERMGDKEQSNYWARNIVDTPVKIRNLEGTRIRVKALAKLNHQPKSPTFSCP